MLSRRWLSVAAALIGGASLASCVSYQQYKDVEEKLAQAQRANDDLVSKYHQKVLREKGQGAVRPAAASANSAEYRRLLAENKDLEAKVARANLRFTRADEDFLKKRNPDVGLAADGSLVLESDLLFTPGVANLKRNQLPALDDIASLLKDRYPGERVIIEGHTDDTPLVKTKKLYEHNWNLGYERASSVFDYLSEKHGIAKNHLVLVTYGYSEPVDTSGTEEARRKNRRVVIRRWGPVAVASQRR